MTASSLIPIRTYVSQGTFEALQTQAREEERSVAAIARRAIERGLPVRDPVTPLPGERLITARQILTEAEAKTAKRSAVPLLPTEPELVPF